MGSSEGARKTWITRRKKYGDSGAPPESLDRMTEAGRRGGKNGGLATGKSKVRGDSEYYRNLVRKKHVDKSL